MMNADELLKLAQAEGPQTTARQTPKRTFVNAVPAIEELRGKGWTWPQVHAWLLEKGLTHAKNPSAIASQYCLHKRGAR